jgi:predicted transcriptional regulator
MANTKQKHVTVRVSAETHKMLKKMAKERQVSMVDLLDAVVREYERKRFWDKANTAWTEMMKDPECRRRWHEEDEDIEQTFASPIIDPYDAEDSNVKE